MFVIQKLVVSSDLMNDGSNDEHLQVDMNLEINSAWARLNFPTRAELFLEPKDWFVIVSL